MYKNNKKGFALTEVLLAIAVIVIIGIGAYSLYATSRNKAITSQTMAEIIEVQTALQKIYPNGATQANATDNGASNLLPIVNSLGLLPSTITLNATTGIYTDTNGVQFNVNVVSNATGFYTIDVYNFNKSVCTDVSTQIIPLLPPNGFVSDGGSVFPNDPSLVSDLVDICAGPTKDSGRLLNFTIN